MLQQSQCAYSFQDEDDQYFCTDVINEKCLTWQFWKDNASNFSRLMQMTKDVLSCLIFLIDIERTFNLAKRVCWWDQSQMSSKMMKQIMLMKYYNRTMNLNSDETITELWDIYHREKNDDQEINKSADLFQVSLKTVLMQIYS